MHQTRRHINGEIRLRFTNGVMVHNLVRKLHAQGSLGRDLVTLRHIERRHLHLN